MPLQTLPTSRTSSTCRPRGGCEDRVDGFGINKESHQRYSYRTYPWLDHRSAARMKTTVVLPLLAIARGFILSMLCWAAQAAEPESRPVRQVAEPPAASAPRDEALERPLAAVQRWSAVPALGPASALRPAPNSAVDAEESAELSEIYRLVREATEAVPPQAEDWGIRVRAIEFEQRIALEDFLTKHPNSTWAPDLHVQLGKIGSRRGNYTGALTHFHAAYEATKAMQDEPGPGIAAEAAEGLAWLLALTGRIAEYRALATEYWGARPVRPSGDWGRAQELASWAERYPSEAYKCGLYGLDQLGQLTQPGKYDSTALVETESSPAGFSIAELLRVGEKVGLRLRAVGIPDFENLPIPAVIHLGVDHYIVVRERRGAFVEVLDPVRFGPRWLTIPELAADATGAAIVAADAPLTGTIPLPADDADALRGRCHQPLPPDHDDQSCPEDDPCCPDGSPGAGGGGGSSGRGGSGCIGCRSAVSDGHGMVTWRVSEPYLNFWLVDTPLVYRSAIGPDVVLQLSMTERFGENIVDGLPRYGASLGGGSAGTPWSCSWFSYVVVDPSGNQVDVMLRSGGWATFTYAAGATNSAVNFLHNARLEKNAAGTAATLYRLRESNGRVIEYSANIDGVFYMSSLRDTASGPAVVFGYQDGYLRQVTAADGAVFTLNRFAGSQYFYRNVTNVATSYGQTVTFANTNGPLLSITDPVGIVSSFNYSAGDYSSDTAVTTPYGTTVFSIIGENGVHGIFDRTTRITHPDGVQEFYGKINIYGLGNWPAFSSTPTNTPLQSTLDTGTRHERNTFYWNRQQFLGLESLPLADFNWPSHLKRARIRHWLASTWAGYTHFGGGAISWEQAPSPDAGTTEGQITFFNYAGKPNATSQGNQVLPAVEARVMPDGSTWYRETTRNSVGRPTAVTEKWNVGWTTYTRSRSTQYDANGLDVVRNQDFDGAVTGFYYAPARPGLPERATNALLEVTYFVYDASNRVSTIQTPAGLLTTRTYFAGNHADSNQRWRLDRSVDSNVSSGVPIATNLYTWLIGNVRTENDPRNLTRTFTLDALNRLTRIDYNSDSSYEIFAYTNGVGTKLLDRTYHRDRGGFLRTWQYDSMRRVTAETDPLGRVKYFEYCDCGDQPRTVVEAYGTALARTTTFVYDTQGNLRTNTIPEGSSVLFTYDPLQRLRVRTDSFESVTNVYDNLGRLVVASNALGRIQGQGYDAVGRVTAQTNANGVALVMSYDAAGRLRTRTAPDGGVESWGYSANIVGPTRYTNQIGKVAQFAYDPRGLRTNEIQVGVWTNSFGYAPAGDLVTLSDGKSQTTTWVYDRDGRVKEKWYQGQPNPDLIYTYDALGRLSFRFTRTGTGASTNGYHTGYTYDSVGNVTYVDYPAGTTDLQFAYDALYRLTNMVDAVGTTRYTYTLGGGNEIVAEDPAFWSSAKVTVTNRLGRRVGLGVQQPSGVWNQAHSYTSGRLGSIASPPGTFTYAYSPASGSGFAARLVQRLTLPSTSYITNAYDSVGRVTSTQLRNSAASVLNQHEYLYNAAGQRMVGTYTNASMSAWNRRIGYSYDNAGQLVTAWTTNSSGVQVAAECWGYLYDPAQNLNQRTNNASGSSVSSFTGNALNQQTIALGNAQTFDRRGNLTAYSNRTLTYDAENQLIQYEISAAYRTVFGYDGRRRLRTRTEYNWNGASWSFASQTRYLYDGMRVVQERDNSNTPTVAYTRGPDLSGTLEGAGGIGGLLSRSRWNGSAWSTNHFYHADSNGNVSYLVNDSQGHGASYKYGPYGATLATSSGTLSASDNTYRFSSKEVMTVDAVYYYGYRFYDPARQVWLNRDPLEEDGGIGLYRFVDNAPNNSLDPLGMASSGSATLILEPTLLLTPEEIAALNAARIALATATAKECEKNKREKCDKEWEDALKRCSEELAKPNPPAVYKPRSAPPGWGVFDCAKGFVSEECGGNPVKHTPKKKKRRIWIFD